MAANSGRVDRVERGARHVAGTSAANPTYCLALQQALLTTRKKTENGQEDETRREIGEPKGACTHWCCVRFDCSMCGGWKQVWEKSHAWISSLDLLDETPTEQVQRLLKRKPRSRYGIKAFGLTSDGAFSIFIGEQKVSEPAEKRPQRVTSVCEELQTNADGWYGREPTPRGVAAADQVSVRKLDYDARVCPWSELCDASDSVKKT